MKKFRIKENDTVRASANNNESGKFLTSLYDSGFTNIAQVKSALLRKIPYTSAKKIDILIINDSEQTSKHLTIKVNN